MSRYDDVVTDLRGRGFDEDRAKAMASIIGSTDDLSLEQITQLIQLNAEVVDPDETLRDAYVFGADEEVENYETYEHTAQFWSSFNQSQDYNVPTDQVEKGIGGSTQQQREITDDTNLSTSGGPSGLSLYDYISPPYDPKGLRYLLELDPIHFRAVSAKVKDSVGRGIMLEANVPVIPNKATPNEVEKYPDYAITENESVAEIKEVEKLFADCNHIVGFIGTLEKAGMDFESIGYCGIEVIRNKKTNKVVRLVHVPAERIRVLEDYSGFVELAYGDGGPRTYYQVFGTKLRSTTRRDDATGESAYYDPDLDGPIERASQHLIDRTTGERSRAKKNSANEMIFKVQHHPKTIYYGVPDIIPAVGYLLANVEIRDYQLQFFKNNTIPRYAIIVKGVKLDPAVVQTLDNYFSQEVKGSAHKTLFIPIPSMRGNVEIIFQKLDSDAREASFQETSSNNDKKIMIAEGTPAAILGVDTSTTIGGGKSNAQAEIYKDRIVSPRQLSWETTLNKLISLGLGLRHVVVRFNPLDVKDRLEESQIMTNYVKYGVLNTNEVRSKADLGDSIPGGNRNWVILSSGLEFVDEFPGKISSSTERLTRAAAGQSVGKPVNAGINASDSTTETDD